MTFRGMINMTFPMTPNKYTDSNVSEDLTYDEDVLAFLRGTNSQSCSATDVSSVLCSLCACHRLKRPMKLLALAHTH